MKEERFIFVAYDITDDQIRQKVSKMLIYYGLIRVQYSLFRGYLRLRDKTMLEEEIRALVDAEDKVHIIELCEECKKRIETIGDVPEVPPHLIL
jgi:CRISPR-associated protein Cas2